MSYDQFIGYAKNTEQFIGLIGELLNNPAKGREERIELAQNHDWDDRVGELEKLLPKSSKNNI